MAGRSKNALGEFWPEEGEFKIEERADGSFWLFEAVMYTGYSGGCYDWDVKGIKCSTRDEAIKHIRRKRLESLKVSQEIISGN